MEHDAPQERPDTAMPVLSAPRDLTHLGEMLDGVDLELTEVAARRGVPFVDTECSRYLEDALAGLLAAKRGLWDAYGGLELLNMEIASEHVYEDGGA